MDRNRKDEVTYTEYQKIANDLTFDSYDHYTWSRIVKGSSGIDKFLQLYNLRRCRKWFLIQWVRNLQV